MAHTCNDVLQAGVQAQTAGTSNPTTYISAHIYQHGIPRRLDLPLWHPLRVHAKVTWLNSSQIT
eukprot:1161469-Pelagomonas_calceolata.AAC.30